MRTALGLALALSLTLSACAGGDDEEPDHGTQASGTTPCDLLSAETADALVEAAEATTGDVRLPAAPMPGQEHFVACQLAPDQLYVAVLAHGGGPLEGYLDGYADGAEVTPLEVGDEAITSLNSWDAPRVVARKGDAVVLLDSRTYDPPDDLVGAMADAATEMLDSADITEIEAVDVADPCPAPDDDLVVDEVGEVVVARGAPREGGASCHYISDDRTLSLSGGAADPGWIAMYQGDTHTEPFDLDGKPAYVDHDEEIVLIEDTDCWFSVTSSPLGWTVAEQRPAGEMQEVLSDLVREARDRIGCG